MTDDLVAKGKRIAEERAAAQINGNGLYPVSDPEPPEPPEDMDPGPSEYQGTSDTPKEPRKTFTQQLLSVADLANLEPVRPLVDGLLYRNTLAQLSGPPGSYKSFVAIGMCCALASGENNWEGHKIARREKVVYVAAEGANGLLARINAWCEYHGVDVSRLDGWLYILPLPVQLGNTVDIGDAMDMAREVGAGLLALDTRARCTLGLEENSATEQGLAVDAAERIRAACGCTVWPIHHTGANGLRPRGSTAWDGAVWSDLRVTGEDGLVKITVEKHKDAPSGRVFQYRMIPYTVSEDLMPGVPEQFRKSLVVFSLTDEKTAEILTGSREKVAKIAENSCGIEGLTRTQLVNLCVEAKMTAATAYRVFNDLVQLSWLMPTSDVARPRYVYAGPILEGTADDQD